MPISEEVVEKLRHVQALASTERGATEEEAKNAATMLSRLLEKHGLDITDLEELEQLSGISHEDLVDTLDTWKQALLYHLTVNNFCKVMVFTDGTSLQAGPASRAVIVGEKQNIAVVREMYAWLAEEFPRITTEALEERKNWVEDPQEYWEAGSLHEYLTQQRKRYMLEDSRDMAWFSPDLWRESYLYGLATGFGKKLEEQRRPPTDLESSFSLMTMGGSEKVNEYVEQNFKTNTVEVTAEVTPAFIEGREKGLTLPTEPQVRDGAESSLHIEE